MSKFENDLSAAYTQRGNLAGGAPAPATRTTGLTELNDLEERLDCLDKSLSELEGALTPILIYEDKVPSPKRGPADAPVPAISSLHARLASQTARVHGFISFVRDLKRRVDL